jgi:hypothetical protein
VSLSTCIQQSKYDERYIFYPHRGRGPLIWKTRGRTDGKDLSFRRGLEKSAGLFGNHLSKQWNFPTLTLTQGRLQCRWTDEVVLRASSIAKERKEGGCGGGTVGVYCDSEGGANQ